jgi:hypothetical protein
LQARQEFREYAQKWLGLTSFDQASERQVSLALARFYVERILNPTKTPVEAEDLDAAIVDGANDLGIDLIHRDDGHVLIIQAKYRGAGKAESANDISHFKALFSALAAPAKLRPNKRLAEKLADVDLRNDSFELVYVSMGKIENQARDLANGPPVYPKEFPDLSERCSWEFLDEAGLNEALRDVQRVARGVQTGRTKLYAYGEKNKRGRDAVLELDAGSYRSIILALEASQLVKLYESNQKDALFASNVRNFLGNTKQNTQIIETASKKPTDFFVLNNGISCVCRELDVQRECVEVSGLQVINGAQTVKALYKAHQGFLLRREHPWPDGEPIVLARITLIAGDAGEARRLREDVTKYNNTQNVVKNSDFRSNDSVQEHLKQQFRELGSRFGKKIVYRPKRTDERPQNAEIISLDDFSKVVYSFLADPVAFSGSTSFLYDDSEGGGYNVVFGDKGQKAEKLTKDEFELRAAIYWLGTEFAEQLKRDRASETDATRLAALERKWMLIYGARAVLEISFPNDAWQHELQKAARGEWKLGDDSARSKWFAHIYGRAKKGVIQAYRTAHDYDPNFNHRNWMRSKVTPVQIATAIRDQLEGESLPAMPH